MSEDKKMPEVAQRRGGADTLFSAEWFDDNDEFTGTKPDQGAREQVAIPSSAPSSAPSYAPKPEAETRSGPPVALIVGLLAVLFLGGGCLVGAVGAGAAFALGLVPI